VSVPDGNGRAGRLWQTLVLSRWKPLLAFLPVETVIRNRQKEHYGFLAKADEGTFSRTVTLIKANDFSRLNR
jgi:Fic family protein